MQWSIHKYYAVSPSGYHIAKNFVIVNYKEGGGIQRQARYMAYCPRKHIIAGSPFDSSEEAMEACSKHQQHSGER